MRNPDLNLLKFECKDLEENKILNLDIKQSLLPSSCPHCRNGILPIQLDSYVNTHKVYKKRNVLDTIFKCPICKKKFIAHYNYQQNYNDTIYVLYPPYSVTPPPRFEEIHFPKEILEISNNFAPIYNQSLRAEFLGLNHVAEPGYRKAFEHLIKDYLIYLNPENENDIKADWLSNCIKRLDYQPLIDVCERVMWLGNDQTHYVPIYEECDLNDLKNIIMTTVSWIVLSHQTQKINSIERRK